MTIIPVISIVLFEIFLTAPCLKHNYHRYIAVDLIDEFRDSHFLSYNSFKSLLVEELNYVFNISTFFWVRFKNPSQIHFTVIFTIVFHDFLNTIGTACKRGALSVLYWEIQDVKIIKIS